MKWNLFQSYLLHIMFMYTQQSSHQNIHIPGPVPVPGPAIMYGWSEEKWKSFLFLHTSSQLKNPNGLSWAERSDVGNRGTHSPFLHVAYIHSLCIRRRRRRCLRHFVIWCCVLYKLSNFGNIFFYFWITT